MTEKKIEQLHTVTADVGYEREEEKEGKCWKMFQLGSQTAELRV